ncbi:hypothetical protein [Candidatus Pelagibacter sp. HIMB1485]|uniref:hypothetical protein n=1 Tax=Candidatus Pelagibacter sp. HIMB1485 TaxID=3415415 RepID=UPI003F85BFF3
MASNESIVDSIKLKNKYHKIIRYLIRKYKFNKYFDKFPNPHFRTSSFLINTRVLFNYLKNKKINNKEDTLMIESGKKSLTNYLKKKNIKIYIVNSEGKKFTEKNWILSETYNYIKKNKSIISDKYTRNYLKLSNKEKANMRNKTWGDEIEKLSNV